MELMLLYVVIPLFATLFFCWGRQLGSRFPRATGLYCTFFLAVSCFVCFFSSGHLSWASWVKPECAYLASYLPALLAVFAVGAISVYQDFAWQKRLLLCGGLSVSLLSLFAAVELRPYVRPLRLAPSNEWRESVCLQSHESSCVPAAAVTLLNCYGISASEKTMAKWAHTSCDGTPPIGSYMALARAVSGSPMEAQVVRLQNELPTQSQLPLLAHVHFEEPLSESRSLSKLFNEFLCGIRARNQGHAVVILGRDENGWQIADPASGNCVWSDKYLRSCWDGEGVYIKPQR